MGYFGSGDTSSLSQDQRAAAADQGFASSGYKNIITSGANPIVLSGKGTLNTGLQIGAKSTVTVNQNNPGVSPDAFSASLNAITANNARSLDAVAAGFRQSPGRSSSADTPTTQDLSGATTTPASAVSKWWWIVGAGVLLFYLWGRK